MSEVNLVKGANLPELQNTIEKNRGKKAQVYNGKLNQEAESDEYLRSSKNFANTSKKSSKIAKFLKYGLALLFGFALERKIGKNLAPKTIDAVVSKTKVKQLCPEGIIKEKLDLVVGNFSKTIKKVISQRSKFKGSDIQFKEMLSNSIDDFITKFGKGEYGNYVMDKLLKLL